MKLLELQRQFSNGRRAIAEGSGLPSFLKSPTSPTSPTSIFWLAIHALCCLVSLVLGFRFSRLLFLLLYTAATTATNNYYYYNPIPILHASLSTPATSHPLPPPIVENNNHSESRVVVGRHGILIRPWPHPNPTEVMKAHRIIQRVQREQRMQYGFKNPRPVIAITPTYARTFQALHVTALMHSLMLVPYDVVWIVVEAGGVSKETVSLIAKSKLRRIFHVPFDAPMPEGWDDRQRMEARMRLHGLRVVREKSLDGIVMFMDDNNIHKMELFDEIQKVNWFGALSVGILAHSGNSVPLPKLNGTENENSLVPSQGPACNSSGELVGWHTFDSSPNASGRRATYVGGGSSVLPTTPEWAGFVFNSRLVWKEAEDRPYWIRDLDSLIDDNNGIKSPLDFLNDASFVEPLGSCGKKVMLWWLRVEARSDRKFPTGWIIDPPLTINGPVKRTRELQTDAPPELQTGTQDVTQGPEDKFPKSRGSRSRHNFRSKMRRSTQIAKLAGKLQEK